MNQEVHLVVKHVVEEQTLATALSLDNVRVLDLRFLPLLHVCGCIGNVDSFVHQVFTPFAELEQLQDVAVRDCLFEVGV